MADIITVDREGAGQRVDNFLIKTMKGVPRTRIYRALRKGEVRVNKKRVKAEYKLQAGDEVRIPPIRMAERDEPHKPSDALAERLEARILFEDDALIIIDKPAGMPVHGGSHLSAGLIEMLRLMRPQQKTLELVHRIDKGTSGCLMIAKKRSALVALQQMLRENKITKTYLLLVKGRWPSGLTKISQPLIKNTLQSGERMVRVSKEGKDSQTLFRVLKYRDGMTLLQATLVTGRTHQIRVHCQHAGFPIVGDEKYGDDDFNKKARQLGIRRMMLHSASLQMQLGDKRIGICALPGKVFLPYLL